MEDSLILILPQPRYWTGQPHPLLCSASMTRARRPRSTKDRNRHSSEDDSDAPPLPSEPEPLDLEKLSNALESVIPLLLFRSTLGRTHVHDDRDHSENVEDTISFLVSEAESSNITMIPCDPSYGRTMDDVVAHPLYQTLRGHLEDLLPGIVRDGGGDWRLVVSDVLDAYDSIGREVPAEEEDPKIRAGVPTECELCSRPIKLTRHHLIPRSAHSILVKRGFYTLEECRSRIAYLCRACHSAVHRFVPDGVEMGRDFASVERLLEVEGVGKWVGWAERQKAGAGLRG